MGFRLEVAFSESVAGVFTLESALDGPDVLSDVGAFAGTYDDLTDDVSGDIRVEMGTDSLAGQVRASTMTATVSRVDDAGYWNPNNPASPLNTVTPGYKPIRPGRLIEMTEDGTEYGVFYGFLRRAPWRLTSRSCELYFEDLLYRASRVYPEIASTGSTTTGAAIGLILDAIGWTWPEWRSLATGDSLEDFAADASKTAVTLIGDLLGAERGTVFVRGDGVVVYESRDMPRTRASSLTLASDRDLAELESAIDGDALLTRVSVTQTGGTTWTAVDADAEIEFGRGDIPAIDSPYVPDPGGQDLADDLVYQGVNGQPPVQASVVAHDDDMLASILSSPLQTVVTIDDPVGGTEGDYIVQRVVHKVGTLPHRADYTLTKRAAREFTLESELDGPDVFRY